MSILLRCMGQVTMPLSAGAGRSSSLPVARPWPRAGLHKRCRRCTRRSKGRYQIYASEEGGGSTGTPTLTVEQPRVAEFATKHLISHLLSPLHAASNTRMYSLHRLCHLSRLAYKYLFSSKLHFYLSPSLPFYNLDTYLYSKCTALRPHIQ